MQAAPAPKNTTSTRIVRCGAGAIALLIALQLVSVTPLRAQTESPIRIPRLAGHTFLPNTLVPDPFVKTFVRNSIGVGKIKDVNIPVIVIDGEPVLGLQGDLVNAILEFEYQQALKRWVAIRLQFTVVGRLGTGVQSLLAEGITANTGFEFGWLFKLAESRRTALSGSLLLSNNATTVINLLDWVNGIIDDEQVALSRTIPSVYGGGNLRFAWAVSDLVGVMLFTELGYGESFVSTSDDDEWYAKLAATIDFDLLAKTSVPLGFALGYRLDTTPQGNDKVRGDYHDFFLRTAFTGSDDFRISLDLVFGRLPSIALNQTLNITSAAIDLRYYF